MQMTDYELIEAFWVELGGKPHWEADFHFYESDWNMLMPVVGKIEELYRKDFPPGEEFIKKVLANEWPIDEHYTNVCALPLGTPIKEVYEAVVEFIKWYNQNKQP